MPIAGVGAAETSNRGGGAQHAAKQRFDCSATRTPLRKSSRDRIEPVSVHFILLGTPWSTWLTPAPAGPNRSDQAGRRPFVRFPSERERIGRIMVGEQIYCGAKNIFVKGHGFTTESALASIARRGPIGWRRGMDPRRQIPNAKRGVESLLLAPSLTVQLDAWHPSTLRKHAGWRKDCLS